MASFLAAVHGGKARTLREDFCGTAGVARAWVRGARGRRAIAVDLDPVPLARAKAPGVRTVRDDVLACPLKADIISATNFPVGYWHTRRELVRYLTQCRKRLLARGVFVCDTYGGATAFTRGTMVRDVRTPAGVRVRYTWEQREADPMSGLVEDAIHFRADRDGEIVYQEADAFVYRWRLWSIPELRDAMDEAGFARSEVYAELGDAVDESGRAYARPVSDPSELDETYVVCIAARA